MVYRAPAEGNGAYSCVCNSLRYTAAGDICIESTVADGYTRGDATLSTRFEFDVEKV